MAIPFCVLFFLLGCTILALTICVCVLLKRRADYFDSLTTLNVRKSAFVDLFSSYLDSPLNPEE